MKNQTQLSVVDEVFPFLLLTGTVVFCLIALEDKSKFFDFFINSWDFPDSGVVWAPLMF